MGSETRDRRSWDEYRHDETGLISFGAFLIIIAVIYLRTPGLLSEIRAFVNDFQLVEVYQGFRWFVPSTNHPVLYAAAEQFCYAFGLVQILVLGLKFARRSSTYGKARTVSGIVFWLGAGYILSLLTQGALSWLSFIAGLIILVGVSIVARAVVLVFAPRPNR
ncbi:MAG TPA: hypothetical protein VED24_03370 [Candidatus Acidoferrum sp.]|nr:hypothetical protein [Candidatus Acidoferrum sp.]